MALLLLEHSNNMPIGSISLDAFLTRRAEDRRLAILTHDVHLPDARGLEFGPADNPTPLPDTCYVKYVDAGTSPHDAVAIDHVWIGSSPLSAVLKADKYDFAIAAQVAQYVPNLLGWFRGIHDVLRPGGVLNLSLPDRRFMFDVGRASSTMAELVEADLLALTRPSSRQLFAHIHEARLIEPQDIWAGRDPRTAPPLCGEVALELAHARTLAALKARTYSDCHCWVFTPSSFLDLIEGATKLGLFQFVLNELFGTEPNAFEFFVSMRRDTQDDSKELRKLQLSSIDHLRKILDQHQRENAIV